MQQEGDMAARIGANFSDYTGNAQLGGAGMPEFKIDTKPLEMLAQYTFAYNKSEYDQRQKDAEAKAKQLADITSYDLTSAIPGDREKIQKGYNELFAYVQKNPDVLDYKNNPKGWMEYNKRKNDFENQLQGGKTRSILYKARQEEATSATNVNEKARLQKELDDEANSSDLMTPLKHTQLYDIKPVEVETPPSTKIDVSAIGANFLGTRTIELPDMAVLEAQSQSGALGFTKLSTDPNSPEYQAQSNSGKLEPVESAKNISAVLLDPKYKAPEFRNADGTLNLDAVIKDNAGNGGVKPILTTIKQFNGIMATMRNQIKSGYFQDKTGKQLSFGEGGGLDENNYRDIDISDGLEPAEILKMRGFAKAKPINYKTDITKTGLGIEQQKIGVDYSQLNETIRHNKATELQQGKELDANIDKWKAASTGTSTQLNGAMERAKRIYADMLKLADKNGVISPDKIRQLNVEQLKYLGIEKTETSDAGVAKTVFQPLSFTTTDANGAVTEVPHAIQLIDGQVRVLTPKPGESDLIKLDNGGYGGHFDPSKSTNLFNIGTNILNEELRIAGNKEVSAYMGVDVTGGITTNTDSGGTSASGSTKSTYKIGGVTLTEDQIQKGAAKYKMSVADYKKSIGL